ncbi:MAG: porin [Bdellovibrionaceae bacterium]|nr:porin [Pseudobdellovibrionaceae bacterium]
MKKHVAFYILGFTFLCTAANAETVLDSGTKVTFGGFVDAYYAFDFNAPAAGDRVFTTQSVRTNEFNINLVHLDANLDSEKLRGRIALQAGTSVDSNYSSEPQRGNVSGGDLSRHIQEARLGHKIDENTWIDVGIFFAHVGAEGWLSKDNIVLTRSLVADYSPYYAAGFKLTHSWSERLTMQLILSNGWQIISENNTDKNVGTGIEYAFDNFTFAYNTLIGSEISPDLNGSPRSSRFRHFHDFVIKSKNTTHFEWVLQLDMGFQKQDVGDRSDDWLGALVMARYSLTPAHKISFRVEHFRDRDQVIVVTGLPKSMNAYGASLGYDQTLESGLLWRNELRYLKSDESIFPKDIADYTDKNFTLTTSLAFKF